MTRWILASDGQPFRDRDAAAIKRDLLVGELGAAVDLDVIDHPAGGFAVSVRPPGRALSPGELGPPDADSPRQALIQSLRQSPAVTTAPGRDNRTSTEFSRAVSSTAHDASSDRSVSDHYQESFRLSPAGRAFIGLHLQVVLGTLLLLQPHWIWNILGLGAPTNATVAALLILAICGCGGLLAAVALTRFLWEYTANTYVIDATGVEQIQWYFERGRLRRRAPRLHFAHLRTVDVDQSVLQMLLNVGTVKLAAGATDSYEVILRYVTAPRALQREFQHRLQRASGSTASSMPIRGDL